MTVWQKLHFDTSDWSFPWSQYHSMMWYFWEVWNHPVFISDPKLLFYRFSKVSASDRYPEDQYPHKWIWLWFFCWSQSCWHPSSRLQVNICRNITQSIHWLICVRLCQQLQEQRRLGFYEKLFGEKMLIIFWPHSIIAYWSGKIQSAINPWLLLLTHSIKT